MTNRPTEAVRQHRDIDRGCTVTMRMRRDHQETVQQPDSRSFMMNGAETGARPAGGARGALFHAVRGL